MIGEQLVGVEAGIGGGVADRAAAEAEAEIFDPAGGGDVERTGERGAGGAHLAQQRGRRAVADDEPLDVDRAGQEAVGRAGRRVGPDPISFDPHDQVGRRIGGLGNDAVGGREADVPFGLERADDAVAGPARGTDAVDAELVGFFDGDRGAAALCLGDDAEAARRTGQRRAGTARLVDGVERDAGHPGGGEERGTQRGALVGAVGVILFGCAVDIPSQLKDGHFEEDVADEPDLVARDHVGDERAVEQGAAGERAGGGDEPHGGSADQRGGDDRDLIAKRGPEQEPRERKGHAPQEGGRHQPEDQPREDAEEQAEHDQPRRRQRNEGTDPGDAEVEQHQP